ncbi:MAG: DUF447 family protein [Pirellulales bacterium]|nr:DUF447 family protein [Pirellulales bacterium]
MILEGLLTTRTADGDVHIAAMGPEVMDSRSMTHLILKPFQGSRTSSLLVSQPEGVFHLTDNVLLFAQAVTGVPYNRPQTRPADSVNGWILEDACEAFEFRIEQADTTGERCRLHARIQKSHLIRPFRGFNRAAHAVIEAAILFSRLHLLDAEEVQSQLATLQSLVTKTAGEQERQAFDLILDQTEKRSFKPTT